LAVCVAFLFSGWLSWSWNWSEGFLIALHWFSQLFCSAGLGVFKELAAVDELSELLGSLSILLSLNGDFLQLLVGLSAGRLELLTNLHTLFLQFFFVPLVHFDEFHWKCFQSFLRLSWDCFDRLLHFINLNWCFYVAPSPLAQLSSVLLPLLKLVSELDIRCFLGHLDLRLEFSNVLHLVSTGDGGNGDTDQDMLSLGIGVLHASKSFAGSFTGIDISSK
jgi:hypothetical protein